MSLVSRTLSSVSRGESLRLPELSVVPERDRLLFCWFLQSWEAPKGFTETVHECFFFLMACGGCILEIIGAMFRDQLGSQLIRNIQAYSIGHKGSVKGSQRNT